MSPTISAAARAVRRREAGPLLEVHAREKARSPPPRRRRRGRRRRLDRRQRRMQRREQRVVDRVHRRGPVERQHHRSPRLSSSGPRSTRADGPGIAHRTGTVTAPRRRARRGARTPTPSGRRRRHQGSAAQPDPGDARRDAAAPPRISAVGPRPRTRRCTRHDFGLVARASDGNEGVPTAYSRSANCCRASAAASAPARRRRRRCAQRDLATIAVTSTIPIRVPRPATPR